MKGLIHHPAVLPSMDTPVDTGHAVGQYHAVVPRSDEDDCPNRARAVEEILARRRRRLEELEFDRSLSLTRGLRSLEEEKGLA
jgi:hypothetical protein